MLGLLENMAHQHTDVLSIPIFVFLEFIWWTITDRRIAKNGGRTQFDVSIQLNVMLSQE